MFLQSTESGTLIKILDIESLINPAKGKVNGRQQDGEEEQDAQLYAKQDLTFPSGEHLPQCWVDADYRLS
jgi:hypothetical protein